MRSAGDVRVRISRRGVVVRVALWWMGFPRVWVWGSSGVPLGRDRGALVSHLCFFEDATMSERGGASMLHPGSTPRVIE